ncbi:MAG: MATE family efflux transporter [Oscillatoriales cyanobacterium C42_A2020_001]|nr:MATE family efflux transporter [Leptolyngbyaceae cyanobacterium C42_A2020_001]
MLIRSRVTAEIRECLYLAIPLAAAQLAQSATGFVDTVMMGLLGSQSLAAGGLGTTAFTFLLLIATGVISAVSPLAAEAFGAENPERVAKVVRQGLWLAIVLAIPLTVLVWNANPLLTVIGQKPETIALTQQYLGAIAWGYFPALGFVALRSFVSALSQPRSVMAIVILGTLLNIAGNYVLMFGKLGFPAMGLAGIGWASTFSLWSMFLALIAYIGYQPSLNQYHVFRHLQRFERKTLRDLLIVGLPISGMITVEAGLFTVTTFLMGQFGTTTLAAHQIALQSAAISFNIPLGISLATTVRVGQLAGKQDFAGSRLAGFIGISLGGLTMGLTALLFWVAPEQVVAWYLDVKNPANAGVVAMAKTLLGVAAVFQIVDGIQSNAAGALRGLKDTQVPLLLAMTAYWGVGLPSGILLSRQFQLDGVGLWWGLAIGLTVTAIALPLRFERRATFLNTQLLRTKPSTNPQKPPTE